MTRKYETLWASLKDASHLQVNFPRREHERIVKALRRESAEDTGFRFKCTEQNKSYVIRFISVDDELYLSLEWKEGVSEMFVITPDKIKRRKASASKYVGREISEEVRQMLKELKG